ncbi:MAG: DNA-directed RNA polymerase subunit omega [Candidatus Latescibacteria bacterium]|nr:DNA-directed RNA polymerase subunit omega [Candidatus Latescibacterota bacterium]
MVEVFFWEDLERQNVNPYESVIGAAREARRINLTRRGEKGLEAQDKPTTLALRRVTSGKAKLTRLSPKEIATLEEAHASVSKSEGKKDHSGGDRGDRGV